MSIEGDKRKLVAILSVSVEGYSRLMGEDEITTVRILTAYQGVVAGSIGQYRGRVVNSSGDNRLAEFASVVDAVRCVAGTPTCMTTSTQVSTSSMTMNIQSAWG